MEQEPHQEKQHDSAVVLGFGQETSFLNTKFPNIEKLGIKEIDIHPANYILTFVAWKICQEQQRQGVDAYLITLGGIAEPNAEFANKLNLYFGENIEIRSDPTSFSITTNLESLEQMFDDPQIPISFPVIICQGFAEDRVSALSKKILSEGQRDFEILSYEEYFNDLGPLEERFTQSELAILAELYDLLEEIPVDEWIIRREGILQFFDENFPGLIKFLAKIRRWKSGIPFKGDLEI